MHKLDLIVIGAFLAVDELRNGLLAFLASQDVITLAVLLAVAWFSTRSKLSIPMPKLGLFDGFLMKTEMEQPKS